MEGKPRLTRTHVSSSVGLWKGLAAFSLALVALENYLLASLTHSEDSSERPETTQLPPEPSPPSPPSPSWFHETLDRFVAPVDLTHLSLLHAACTSGEDPIISWRYGVDGEADASVLIQRGDPRALEELRRCPDVDIYLPVSIRGSGYCEDGGAYTKYMHSRLLPRWALEDRFFDLERNRWVKYYDLCPRTPMLFMNHYWDFHHESADWPKDKPIYVMPNIEMGELTAADYWRVDAVLCKTHGCYDRVSKWYAQEGNPRGAKVFYTRHTTADVANYARGVVGNHYIRPKDFTHVRFVHTAGGSVQKNTVVIVSAWLERPDLPPLDVYMDPRLYNSTFRERFGAKMDASTNLHVHTEPMNALNFGRLLAGSSFFLCPSVIEGYGHYINQARAAGGVIVTTDAHPMNELIAEPDTGVYVETQRKRHRDMLLGGDYKGEHGLQGTEGLVAETSATAIASAVDRILDATTPDEREAMAKRVQAAYHEDTKFFAQQMRKVCAYARAQADSKARVVAPDV